MRGAHRRCQGMHAAFPRRPGKYMPHPPSPTTRLQGIGFVCDRIGRKWGSVLNAALMFVCEWRCCGGPALLARLACGCSGAAAGTCMACASCMQPRCAFTHSSITIAESTHHCSINPNPSSSCPQSAS